MDRLTQERLKAEKEIESLKIENRRLNEEIMELKNQIQLLLDED